MTRARGRFESRGWGAVWAFVFVVTSSSRGEEAEAKPAASGKWPYHAVASIEVPRVDAAQWSRRAVDAFVYAKLSASGLTPAAEIDRRTWIRRVTFDLTGLPVSIADLEAFLGDPSSDAVAREKVADRLLGSPEYGDHLASMWLDVARYADSDGYAIDGERPTLWRYRDYVIRSFNEDRPFDEFVREQIAGDVLRSSERSSRGLVAAGFLRLGPWEADNMVAEDRRQDYLDEVTTATGTAFLGLTVGCARCHDHKYDPVSAEDYYSLQAFFANAQRTDRSAEFDPDEIEGSVESRRAAVEEEAKRRASQLAEFRLRLKKKVAAALEKQPEEIADAELAREPAAGMISAEEKKKLGELEASVKNYVDDDRFGAVACSVTEDSKKDRKRTAILIGGDLARRGKEVEPAVPTWLAAAAFESPRAEAPPRARLAEWLAVNPLAARVFVNRLWQQVFGRGIVATPNDFGLNGAGASHPELLEHLTARFVAGGRRAKPILRELVLSRTYRLATTHPNGARCAEVDPENRLLWRANYRRLSAEELRDAILFVSGRLRFERGGPGFLSALPPELGSAFPFFNWQPSSENDRRRRSVFHFQRRNLLPPFFEAFDACDRSASTGRRSASVITPQALSLLNGSLTQDASRALARRVRDEGGSELEGRLDRMFLLAFARRPAREEIAVCREFLAAQATRYKGEAEAVARSEAQPLSPRDRAWVDLAHVVLNANEFLYLE